MGNGFINTILSKIQIIDADIHSVCNLNDNLSDFF